MQSQALLRYSRISPQKLRTLAGIVRGRPVNQALTDLKAVPRKGARILEQVIRSAAANAADRHGADVDQLTVQRVLVDGGPMLKRFTPRAQGRATPIRKRTSQVVVVVGDEA